MHAILPTAAFSKELYSRSQLFTEQFKLSPLTLQGSVEAVFGILEEGIFGRLYWATPGFTLDSALNRHLSWWPLEVLLEPKGETDRYCHYYYSEVVDPVELKILAFLDPIIGQGNDLWKIWHTLRLGDDYVIESGEDYRIVEFERRVQSGEWKVGGYHARPKSLF